MLCFVIIARIANQCPKIHCGLVGKSLCNLLLFGVGSGGARCPLDEYAAEYSSPEFMQLHPTVIFCPPIVEGFDVLLQQ